ncbi:MAG: HAMP domain-containing protein, partial [Lachnospiraceae bacterium]|nr:HAMP domain-containing protein [Lachnospiraceae bacterium]
MKISDHMNVFTIRKKILLASKLMGVILVLSYVFSTRLPFGKDVSLMIWLLFVAALICVIDLWMARFISKPVSELNDAAGHIANFDFSQPCRVAGHDEFGELSHSLNVMAGSLRKAFEELEHANAKLEQDVEQKTRLLAARKELVDTLSHEMQTPLGVV